MAYIQVDVDLDEFDNDEIVSYLCRQIEKKRLDKDELDELSDALKNHTGHAFRIETTTDKFKLELMEKYFDEYTLEELEARLKMDLP